MFEVLHNAHGFNPLLYGENTKKSRREGLKTIVLFLLLRAPVYVKLNTFPVQQGLKAIVGDTIIHNNILLILKNSLSAIIVSL